MMVVVRATVLIVLSLMPVTVTVCDMFQSVTVKVRAAGDTVAAERSSLSRYDGDVTTEAGLAGQHHGVDGGVSVACGFGHGHFGRRNGHPRHVVIGQRDGHIGSGDPSIVCTAYGHV